MDEFFSFKQSKFGGEVSPLMYGDTAHIKYGSWLRTCKNWLPLPQGALAKRPATRFVGPFKDATANHRMIPFVFSDGQTFVLEFGQLYVRFWQGSKYVSSSDNVLHPFGAGLPWYELVTPYTYVMLPYLKFRQVGDTITITYGGQDARSAGSVAPQDLVRTSGAIKPWTIGPTPTKIPVGAVSWLTGSPTSGVGGFQFTGARAGQVYTKGERAVQLDSALKPVATEWICIQEGTQGSDYKPPDPAVTNAAGTGVAGNLFWMPAVDTAHQAVKSLYVQTAVVQDTNGIVYESAPSPVLATNSSLSSDRQYPIVFTQASLAAGYTLLYYRLYRAIPGGIYGWVNDVPVANLVSYPGNPANSCYLDDGRSPDPTKQPPQGTDPFLVNGVDSYPCVVGYLDQRRLWASSGRLPSALWLSKPGNLYNYDSLLVPGADTDAMIATIAAEELEQIRAFVSLRRGLLLTSQGEWTISGMGGGPVSRSSLDLKRQSKWGSSWIDPVVIGNGLLFNTAKSNMVRDLYPLYGTYTDIWDGQDLTSQVRHLFDQHTVKAWAFQSTPYPILWIVREDGALISLTYQHAPPSFGTQVSDGVVAWARHDTGSDTFEDVVVVPEPPEDAVYFMVKRTIGGVTSRLLERMISPVCPDSPYSAQGAFDVNGIFQDPSTGSSDVRYGVFLDSSVQYDGHVLVPGVAGDATKRLSLNSVANPGSGALADYVTDSLVLVGTNGAALSAGIGDEIRFDPDNILGAGSFVVRVSAVVSGTSVKGELQSDLTQGQLDAWRNPGSSNWYWGIAKLTLDLSTISPTNLYLAGATLDSGDVSGARGLMALVDGDSQIPASFVGNILTLQNPGLVVQVGLAYNADVELLDAYSPNAEIRNRLGNVLRVGFEVSGARDLWVGKDLTSLSQWIQRQVVDAYGVMGLQTGYFEQFVVGNWNKNKRGALRHFQPLPCVLTSVLREISLGKT